MHHCPFLEVVPMVVLQYYFKLMYTDMSFITFCSYHQRRREGWPASLWRETLKTPEFMPSSSRTHPRGHMHIATHMAGEEKQLFTWKQRQLLWGASGSFQV